MLLHTLSFPNPARPVYAQGMPAHATTPIITVHNAFVRAGANFALRGVTWSLAPGTHWAVLGRNGAGKSTFLRLLRGAVHPAQGRGTCQWHLDGAPADALAARDRIAVVSPDEQDAFLRTGPNLTGEELIITGLRRTMALFSPPTEDERRTAHSLLAAHGAEHLAQRAVRDLSRGQGRLVFIIRALATAPAVLLLDEAFDGLDRAARRHLRAVLDDAAASTAVVLCSHRRADLPRIITHVALIEDGRITRHGPVADELAAIRDSSAVDCKRRAAPAPQLTPLRADAPSFLVRMRGASVRRNGRDLVSDADWTIRPGERWAVLGANGAGKSTLLRLVTAEYRSAAPGTVEWFGHSGATDIWSVRRRLGMVSPEIQANYRYDVAALEFVQSGFFASVSLWRAPSPEQTERARQLMEFVDMAGMDARSIRSLSYGQLRRLLIARALAPRPDLLLLDEPYAGLDTPSRARLAAIITALCEAGASLVLTAHRAEELPPGLTHALVLDDGRITTRRAVTSERDARALLP